MLSRADGVNALAVGALHETLERHRRVFTRIVGAYNVSQNIDANLDKLNPAPNVDIKAYSALWPNTPRRRQVIAIIIIQFVPFDILQLACWYAR